jgi:hypothetical protein
MLANGYRIDELAAQELKIKSRGKWLQLQPLLASRSSVGHKRRIELPFLGHVYGERPAAAVQLVDAAQVAVPQVARRRLPGNL